MTEDHRAAETRHDPQGTPGRGVLAAFIFSLVIVQGVTINLMPVLFGTIARTFQINFRQEGQLQSFFLAGGIIALFVSGYATETVGAKRSGILAVIFVGAGALLLGLAATYVRVLTAAFVMGLGTMWILPAFSAVITAHFADVRRRMFMWTMAVFAGSATISTSLFGYLVEVTPRWNLVFFAFAALVWLWFAVFLVVFRAKLRAIGRPAQVARAAAASPLRGCETMGTGTSPDTNSSGLARPGSEPVPISSQPLSGPAAWLPRAIAFLARGIFNRPIFWLLGLLWILESLTAGTIVTWTGRFFQVEHHVSSYQVGLMISASSAGVFAGRLLMGAFLSGRFSDRAVMGSTFAGGILMYVVLLLVPSYPLGLALMFLNGALIAAQAPTMYALASVKFGDRAVTVIPLVQACGYLGGFMGPTLVGFLAGYYGLRAVLWLIPAMGAVFVAIVFAWEIVDRRRAWTEPDSIGRPGEIRPKPGDQLV